MLLTEVAEAFENSGVRYAIAGGYAVALHGAVRGTLDLDVVLALDRDNYVAAERALEDLGLRSKLPVRAEQVFDFRDEYIEHKNLVAWSFFDPSDPTRLVDVIITFASARLSVVQVAVRGQPIQLLSKRALIEMKKASGREQDLEDVRALESLP